MTHAVEVIEERHHRSPRLGASYHARLRCGRFEAYVGIAGGLVEVHMICAPHLGERRRARAFQDLPAALNAYRGWEMRTIITRAQELAKERPL